MTSRIPLPLLLTLAACTPHAAADPRTPEVTHPSSNCARPDQCTAGYDGFVERAAEHDRPVPRDELWRSLWAIVDAKIEPAAAIPAGSTLPAQLQEAANLRWLLAEADKAPATITECGSTLWGPAKQITLCIDDPWVGNFQALLLLPGPEGPFPAVVAHPGHAESAAYHRDHRMGRELIEAGYIVTILEPRAFAGDEYEHAVTERLLLQGHSLVGLRLYEAAILHGYLASRPDVDGAHIALMGHSGGSDPTSLAAFVDPRWEATVIDLVGWFMARVDDGGKLSSEASPALWRWHRLVESTEPPVPRLRQDYGYPTAGAVLEFLDRHLKQTEAGAGDGP